LLCFWSGGRMERIVEAERWWRNRRCYKRGPNIRPVAPY
jgi:hypothetical protein